ncbi:MAG: CARDB domain-containing protein [bacterium]|nr:CARDB domain-containing protein [bacterium]
MKKYPYVIISLLAISLSGCTSPFQNLLIKDSLVDKGIPVSGNKIFWLSPDIWLDNNDDGKPDEFPVIRKPNKLFARISNIGDSEAKDITVKFYANQANTYFSYEENSLIGTAVIPSIAPGESAITSISWKNIKEGDFWAWGVAVHSSEDSIDKPKYGFKLACRSFWSVYTCDGMPIILRFRVENPSSAKANVSLTLDRQRFPGDWQAHLGKESFDLLPKESKPVLLMVTPAFNPKDKEGMLHVISKIEGKIVGGVSYRIKVKE